MVPPTPHSSPICPDQRTLIEECTWEGFTLAEKIVEEEYPSQKELLLARIAESVASSRQSDSDQASQIASQVVSCIKSRRWKKMSEAATIAERLYRPQPFCYLHSLVQEIFLRTSSKRFQNNPESTLEEWKHENEQCEESRVEDGEMVSESFPEDLALETIERVLSDS